MKSEVPTDPTNPVTTTLVTPYDFASLHLCACPELFPAAFTWMWSASAYSEDFPKISQGPQTPNKRQLAQACPILACPIPLGKQPQARHKW